jgi:hypothetical protein
MLAYSLQYHPFHFRIGHGHNLHWYEFILLPLAIMAVYPDKVLSWLFPKADRIYQLVVLELAVISLLIVGTICLQRMFADFVWWTPLALVFFCSIVRVILFVIDNWA